MRTTLPYDGIQLHRYHQTKILVLALRHIAKTAWLNGISQSLSLSRISFHPNNLDV